MIFWRGLRILLLLGIFVLISLGFQSWRVTGFVQQRLDRVGKEQGWKFSVGEATWVPWRSLKLEDLQLQTPHGAKLHVVRAYAVPRLAPLTAGALGIRCELGEIRMDPLSWKIRRPMAQELLSAGAVTRRGSLLLRLGSTRVTIDRLSLDGPLLRAEAHGWLQEKDHQGELFLQGALAQPLLRSLNLGNSDPAVPVLWEPFQVMLGGAWERPQIRFTSHFITFAMNLQGDKP